MTPISVASLALLERVFNGFMPPSQYGIIAFYEGTFYFIDAMHYGQATRRIHNRVSSHRMMCCALFAFQLKPDQTIVLIKSRFEFEVVAKRLATSGFEVEPEESKKRATTEE